MFYFIKLPVNQSHSLYLLTAVGNIRPLIKNNFEIDFNCDKFIYKYSIIA